MAILSPIQRDTNNGVSIVRMHVSDTLSQVGSINYIANNQSSINVLNNGFWQWYLTDMVLVSAADGNQFFYFTDSTFSTLIQTSSGAGDVTGPSSSTNDALARFNGATGKIIQNSNVTLTDPGSMTFASGQSISLPGASFVAANSFNGITVQFKGGNATNAIVLQAGQTDSLSITDGSAPNGYLEIDTTNQDINLPVPLNLTQEISAINFDGVQFTTGTISGTGATVTFSAGATARFVGGYVTPGIGASFTPFHILEYSGTSTVQVSLSQTISAGSAFVLTYQTINNNGSFNLGSVTQTVPYFQNMFGGFDGLTFGTSSNQNFMFNCWGSALFPNTLVVGGSVDGDIRYNGLNSTANQSGNTVTATSTAFVANQDEGKIILFSEGQVAIITSVSSGTVVSVDRSQTVAQQQFRVMGQAINNGGVCYMDGYSGQMGCQNAHILDAIYVSQITVSGSGSGTIEVLAPMDFQTTTTFEALSTFFAGIDVQGNTIANLPTVATTSAPSSATATSSFGSSLTLGTAIQNTLGYDALVNITFVVSSATTATLIMGVGSTNTPTTDTIVTSFGVTGVTAFITLCAVVPNNYYLLVNNTGTFTATNKIVVTPI